MKNFVEYAIVFDGKPVYSIREAKGYRSRVSGVIEDLLVRFGSAACDRIIILRHTVADVPTSFFVTSSGKDAEDAKDTSDSNLDATK